LLWSLYHAKNLFPKIDEATQSVFQQALSVGNLAKRMFPNGIEIQSPPSDFNGAVQLTKAALLQRRPIFEATAAANGGYARADILNPVGEDEWDILEVKSTTRPKAIHIPDIAFQRWVFESAGFKIRRCFICHVNREFVGEGEFAPRQFFTFHDATDEVAAMMNEIGEKVRRMAAVVALAECPPIMIGKHCGSPFLCPLRDHCWAFLPPRNVTELFSDTKGRGFDLLSRGVLRLADIPEDYQLNSRQGIQRATAISGVPHVNQTQIQRFLDQLKYPLHFLDFESFQSAVPFFYGTRPYEQIPFQFSLHLLRSEGAEPEHRKFLAYERIDPRLDFIQSLERAIEPTGSIVTFNAAFEKGRLMELAERFPQYEMWVESVVNRMVDLMIPFRGFSYYHPDQRGRVSIKSVLLVLTGKDYKSLEIQKGDTAGWEFLRVTFFTDVSQEERHRVRRALDLYCGQDTEGMVWILEALRNYERDITLQN